MIGHFFARLSRKMVPALKALSSGFAPSIMCANDPSSTMLLRFHCLTNSLPRCPDRFLTFLLLSLLASPSRLFPSTLRPQAIFSMLLIKEVTRASRLFILQSPCALATVTFKRLYYSWQPVTDASQKSTYESSSVTTNWIRFSTALISGLPSLLSTREI